MGTLFWTQRHYTGPSPRRNPAMAFDPVQKRTVLLGGEGAQGPNMIASAMADTWERDGSYWTQTADIGPPSAGRYEMAWDPSTERVLLFGGAAFQGGDGDLARCDTWAWDGQAWTQLLDKGMRFRTGFAMATDTLRGRVVLFGGATLDEAGQLLALADTWEWSGGEWTQQEDVGPSPRSGHAMSFDAVRNVCVLNGGVLITGEPQPDTWEWDGARWTRRSEVGPAGRIGASMVFTGQYTLLFGGQDRTSKPPVIRGETWSWDGRHWTQRQDIGPKRESHGMAFDATRERTIVFGGQSEAGVHGDTWELKDHAR